MKIKFNNLCEPVRLCLTALGVSTVAVVNAINSALGDMGLIESDGKLGNATVKAKAGLVRQRENIGNVYEAKRNAPLDFKSFNDSIQRTVKLFPSFTLATLPVEFDGWIAKFKADPSVTLPSGLT